MVAVVSKKTLHCPRCGQSFHAEDVMGEHAFHDFICSVCSFEFQMKYDSRRQVYLPLVEVPLPVSSGNCNSGGCSYNRSSNKDGISNNSSYSNGGNSSRGSRGEHNGYDPIAVRLKQKWQEVLEEFNTSELHSQFIDLCHQLGRLEFAKERYDYLKQALGDDPEVSKRIRQIEMKLLQIQEVTERITYEDQKLPYWRRFGTLFLVSILLALTGTLLPALRWVSFLGVFILAGLLFNSIKK